LPKKQDINQLFEKYNDGDRLALSRLISLVENNSPQRDEIVSRVYNYTKDVYRIGLTGPPGVGKSTLVNEIVFQLREDYPDEMIGIVAVDPSSPFTGGALLGDRIRMNRISLEKNVFIRSLATRGSLGGLAIATEDVIDLLDGFGCGIIIIETVGVGQAELDIIRSSDTTLVTLIPGGGDSIQAMKAGLMEIGDIFVLNKSDREGTDRAYIEIETALHFRPVDGWQIPIMKTTANQGEGIAELTKEIFKHRNFIKEAGIIRRNRQQRRRQKIYSGAKERIEADFWDNDRLKILDRLVEEDISVISAVETLLKGEI
jgi:LAO/AO transport system kinase